jgi:hypothetical protein
MARVQGLATAVSWAGIPLGGLIGGAIAGVFGIHTTLVALGTAYLLVTLAPLIWPVWRRLDDRPATVAVAREPVGTPG